MIQVLRPDEVESRPAACDASTGNGARDLAVVTLFLDTGLRLSELVGLALDDLHLKEGWLKVFGKGEKERIVPFGSRATRALGHT